MKFSTPPFVTIDDFEFKSYFQTTSLMICLGYKLNLQKRMVIIMNTLLRIALYLSIAANCYFLKRLLEDSYKQKKYDSNSKMFLERMQYKNFRHASKAK